MLTFLAEAAALELLCPVPIRRVVEAQGLEDHEEVCEKYGVPYETDFVEREQ
jgi:hypothetical protein